MTDGFKTTNYWTIIMLMVSGYSPTQIEAQHFEDSNKCQLTYHFEANAEEAYEKWMLGQPMGVEMDPYEVLRKTREVQDSFKHNLHRFIGR